MKQTFIKIFQVLYTPHVKGDQKMFGWILKTDWDIDEVMDSYKKRRIETASVGLDMEARIV